MQLVVVLRCFRWKESCMQVRQDCYDSGTRTVSSLRAPPPVTLTGGPCSPGSSSTSPPPPAALRFRVWGCWVLSLSVDLQEARGVVAGPAEADGRPPERVVEDGWWAGSEVGKRMTGEVSMRVVGGWRWRSWDGAGAGGGGVWGCPTVCSSRAPVPQSRPKLRV